MQNNDKIKIVIADDHQIVLDGLRAIIEDHKEFELIADVSNGKLALDVVQNIEVDVVLLDIDMPVMNGIEATRQIKKCNAGVKILILSMHHEKNLIKNLLHCGVDGYVLKNANTEVLIEAINAVHSGEKYFDEDVLASLQNKDPIEHSKLIEKDGLSELTTREIEILKLIAEGNSNKQIGEKINISHRTVDTHRTNIMKKIGVNNIAGIIRFAMQRGIID